MPWWVSVIGVVLWILGTIAALAFLGRAVGRDTARAVAAAYWVGKGDRDKAERVLRGERP